MSNNEKWIKWEPIGNLSPTYPYVIDEIIDNLEGLTIILSELDNENIKIRVFFEDSVNAYRCTEESYRLNIDDYFVQPDGKNLYKNWVFFKVKNSKYLDWLEKESCGFFQSSYFTHYIIFTENRILDLATIGDPIVEVISF